MSTSSDPTMLPGSSSQKVIKDESATLQHDDDLDKDIEEIDLHAEVKWNNIIFQSVLRPITTDYLAYNFFTDIFVHKFWKINMQYFMSCVLMYQ